MADIPAYLARRLLEEGRRVAEFFEMLPPEQWEQPVYTEGTHWDVRHILAHFVTTEKSMAQLLHNVQAGGPGASEDFDIDRFNEGQAARLLASGVTAADLLGQYGELRQAMAEWVGSLAPADLQKTGRHPFMGIISLEEMIKLLYRHNQIHLRDLRKALATL